jgi:serine/threonine-protein kinase
MLLNGGVAGTRMETMQSLGKYELRGTLGRGAMGTVYDGWDTVIQRRVAIKTVSLPEHPDPETEEEIARFRREAQAAGRLTHPNIVAIYDYGETSDLAYIVMEYVDGPTLKSLLDKHERFPVPEVCRVMVDLLAGLQFSHDRGVVHRDIKPANVMLSGEKRAKIADFGIARIESSNMTQAGTVLGTPAYMSPEQFRGEPVDVRTDIYSSGVLLYQLLTGERPFEGSVTSIMHKVLNVAPPAPSQLSAIVPPALDEVVLRAMAKRPEERYASAAAFAEAIGAAMEAPPASADAPEVEATMVSPARGAEARSARSQPAAAAPASRAASSPAPSQPPSAPRPLASERRRSLAPLLGGMVALLLLMGGGAWWFLLRPAGETRVAAPTSTPTAPPAEPTAPSPTPVPAPTASAPASPAPSPARSPAAPSPAVPPSTASAPPAPAPPSSSPAPPAATPLAPATQASAPVASPPRPAPIEVRAAAMIADTSCVLAHPAPQPDPGTDGGVTVAGFAGTNVASGLRQHLQALPGAAPLGWKVQALNPVFCPALAVLRPVAPAAGTPSLGLRLALAGGQTALHDGARILPRVTMPRFAGYVRVDYLGHDGSVVHLYPTVADPAQHFVAVPAQRLSPGAVLRLGDSGAGRPLWEVGPPYGTDMIIAVASAKPLLPADPPQNVADSAGAYLRRLAAAISAARAAGEQVTASLLPVDTLPPKK